MNIDRLRAPALAALAVLAISGTGTVLASTPTSSAPANITPVVATTPAPVVAAPPVVVTTTPAPVIVTEPVTEPVTEATEVPSASEPAGTAADAAGGHQDPDGQNVDHQFDGQE